MSEELLTVKREWRSGATMSLAWARRADEEENEEEEGVMDWTARMRGLAAVAIAIAIAISLDDCCGDWNA